MPGATADVFSVCQTVAFIGTAGAPPTDGKGSSSQTSLVRLFFHATLSSTGVAVRPRTSLGGCGAMMQQNPEASALFGMDSAENSVYVDFDKKGEKPVDRLKLLFAGANEDLYDEMWESVMEKGEPWVTKMRLWPHNLRPEAAMVGDSSVSSSMWSSTSSREEEAMFGKARWFYVSVNKFNDPADGSVLMFLEMKDITEIEEAKIKYVEQRKQEHALLSSIIPEHIIQVLVEENREMQNSARSSSKSSKSMSSSSGELLDLSAMRMDTENKRSWTQINSDSEESLPDPGEEDDQDELL